MTDPMSGVVDLEQAIARLAADISDKEVHKEKQRQKNDAAISFSELHWLKREIAITRLYAAFCNGSLIAVVVIPARARWFESLAPTGKGPHSGARQYSAALCAHKWARRSHPTRATGYYWTRRHSMPGCRRNSGVGRTLLTLPAESG
jgi:hypothetical protein